MRDGPLLGLNARVAIIAFLAVVIQTAAVSQISIFGVSADITVLVVMSVGLLCGSMTGAVVGFGIGLFLDMALVQTLGITSLLYILIGYWSGRLRELSDPSHGLVPLGVGAAATAVSAIGMAIIQFLLGVDGPVSILLLQQIFLSVLLNTLIALPIFHLVQRILRSALPLRHRRGVKRYTGNTISPLQQPSGRLRPALRRSR
jgi:rod shape-determining protein MreD